MSNRIRFSTLRVAICLALSLVLAAMPVYVVAQDVVYPSATPKMTIQEDGEPVEEENYSGSAPVVAHFTSNVSDLGSYIPRYEWRFYAPGNEEEPTIVRYDADVDYTFNETGTTSVKLYITFVGVDGDTIEFEQEEPFSVDVSTSLLEMPNAFSPNGDGQNDIYKAKDGYQSIVSFHAYIFNRWGKKIYEWSDIAGGWDGTSGGKKVPDGVYFCYVKAKGADGKQYHIKKAVNLLRGYGEDSTLNE